jgi:hypothetical protein
MPRVNFVKAARKDNPICKKGESYYWWKFRYGGKRYSLTRPRPSQLTQSAYYSSIRSLAEQIGDHSTPDDNDELTAFRDEIKDEIESIRDECQGSLDNMPDQLQYAPTGELLQERIDACDEAINELKNIEEFDEDEPVKSDFADGDDSEFQEALSTWESDRHEHFENAISLMSDAVSNCEV